MNTERARLNDADARVIDALLKEGLDPESLESTLASMSAADRARAEAALRLLSKLEKLPAPAPSPALVAALMGRIDVAEQERRERMRVSSTARRWRTVRLPDLATIAAVLLLAVGVGWPLAQSVRSASMREQCERNMGSVHAGLARFAADNDDRLPLAAGLGAFFQSGGERAGAGNTPGAPLGAGGDLDGGVPAASAARVNWRTYRHGDNLELLREREYVGSRCLTCPGCEKDRGAMALRVPAVGQRFALGTVRGMLVVDANSAIELLRDGEPCGPGITASSSNHRRQGQNVLFDDGSVRWLLSPILPNGDSIWAPCDDGDPAAALEQGFLPTDPRDVFLAQ